MSATRVNYKMRGIDVSKWQGEIDWGAVAAAGMGFAILKAGGSDAGFYRDRYFEQNYKRATAEGLAVGAYYFVGKKFLSEVDGIADARRFMDILDVRPFEMPVYLDVETTSPKDKMRATEAAIAFLEELENNGYYAGIYASDVYGFRDRLDDKQLAPYDHWVARYGSAPKYVEKYGMWQTTDKGRIPGVNSYVDLDYAYKLYPEIMRKYGLNKVKKEGNTP